MIDEHYHTSIIKLAVELLMKSLTINIIVVRIDAYYYSKLSLLLHRKRS